MRPADLETLLLVTRSPGETRIARLEDGVVVEVHHFRDHQCQVGDLYLARVGGKVPGIAAVFVSLGAGERDAFLAAEDGPDPLLPEGSALIVEVLQPPRPGKGAKVTAKATLAGAFVVYTPSRSGVALSSKIAHKNERRRLTEWAATTARADEGVVIRTAAFDQPEAALSNDLLALRAGWDEVSRLAGATRAPALLRRGQLPLSVALAGGSVDRILCENDTLARDCRRARPDLAERVRVATGSGVDLFAEEGVDEAIEDALQSVVTLPGGGAIRIEETAALVAIDIDSGAAGASAANRAAVGEIARQLRLRNLAGQIVIDIADPAHGASSERRAFAEALAALLRRDPVPTRVVGLSPMGLVEVQRDRRGPTLASRLIGPRADADPNPESVALAALRQVERAVRVQPGLRAGLIVHPRVSAALAGPLSAALAEVESRLGHRIAIDDPPRLALGSITIFDSRERTP